MSDLTAEVARCHAEAEHQTGYSTHKAAEEERARIEAEKRAQQDR